MVGNFNAKIMIRRLERGLRTAIATMPTGFYKSDASVMCPTYNILLVFYLVLLSQEN